MRLEAWHIIIVLLLVAAFVVVLAVRKASARNAMVGANTGPVGYAHGGGTDQPQPSGTNIFAILALIFGFLAGLLGIVFGHIARAQIRQTGQAGAGMALAGLVLGYGWLALMLGSFMFIVLLRG